MTSQIHRSQCENQALLWTIRMRSGEARSAQYEEFKRWLTACEENAAAYVYMSQLWEATGALDRLKELEPVDVPGEPALDRLDQGSSRLERWLSGPSWLTPRALGIAASVLIVALGAFAAWYATPTKHVYTTGIGDVRHVELSDGSTIDIGPGSKLEVTYLPDSRKVSLTGGEALFSVAHDKTRPFSVMARGGRITALGTRFNVHDGPDTVTVSVLEGRVEVLTAPGEQGVPRNGETIALATQNEEVSYANNGPIKHIGSGSVRNATAWTRGMLAFDNDRLERVIADASRFAKGRIVIEDDSLKNMRVTAVFRAGDLDTLANELERVLPIVALRVAPDLILLKHRQQPAGAPLNVQASESTPAVHGPG